MGSKFEMITAVVLVVGEGGDSEELWRCVLRLCYETVPLLGCSALRAGSHGDDVSIFSSESSVANSRMPGCSSACASINKELITGVLDTV